MYDRPSSPSVFTQNVNENNALNSATHPDLRYMGDKCALSSSFQNLHRKQYRDIVMNENDDEYYNIRNDYGKVNDNIWKRRQKKKNRTH